MCVRVVLSGDSSIFFIRKVFTNINLILSVGTTTFKKRMHVYRIPSTRLVNIVSHY